mgnify:CR=1 FL=1
MDDKRIICHERLAIVDPAGGAQPIVSPDGKIVLTINAEIYNHREIRDNELKGYPFKTGSDCEVLIPLVR